MELKINRRNTGERASFRVTANPARFTSLSKYENKKQKLNVWHTCNCRSRTVYMKSSIFEIQGFYFKTQGALMDEATDTKPV